jgi:hypothetical protein
MKFLRVIPASIGFSKTIFNQNDTVKSLVNYPVYLRIMNSRPTSAQGGSNFPFPFSLEAAHLISRSLHTSSLSWIDPSFWILNLIFDSLARQIEIGKTKSEGSASAG